MGIYEESKQNVYLGEDEPITIKLLVKIANNK